MQHAGQADGPAPSETGPHSLFDVAPDDSEKLEETSTDKTKPHAGGQLTDEDFGDDEVERITGGEPENEKISGSDAERDDPTVEALKNQESAKETVYSDV